MTLTMPSTFCGCDTGVFGAFAGIDFDGARILAVRIAAMPTRERDEGGREVIATDAREALRVVAPRGWTSMHIERPVRGGMKAQQKGVEFAQGDAHGVARATCELAADGRWPMPTPAMVVGQRGWHQALGMMSAAKAGVDRKTLSIQVAEDLLSRLRDVGGVTIDTLPKCRGYDGLLGGASQPRSGAADALLLAWHGLRVWLGVAHGTATLSLGASVVWATKRSQQAVLAVLG